MKRKSWIALVLILAATAAWAEPGAFGLPPGKWWRMPRVVERLALTADQQDKMDDIFAKTAPDLIDLRAEMEKRALALREQLDQDRLDPKAISAAANALSDIRGRMFNRELMMMIEMRNVLSDKQWKDLRGALEQRGTAKRDERRRPQGRNGPGANLPPKNQ